MSSRARSVLGVLIILAAVAVGGYLFARYQIRKSYPEVSGTMETNGLRQSVEIFRDSFSVPRIVAQNEHDLLFALGYVHAQDRLWQMDMARRIVQGRLSEIIGDRTLPFDRMFRIIGLRALAEETDKRVTKESRVRLEAYTDGVNAFIDSHRGKFPVEFDMLGYEPELWQPVHSIMIAKLMAWELNLSWWVDLTLGGIVEHVGFEKAQEVFPTYPAEIAPIVPSVAMQKTISAARSFLDIAKDYCDYRGIGGVLGGSNAWAIAPAKSVNNAPMLANDVHLQLTNPSKFYEVTLSAPGYDAVTGASVPGIPGVVLGHNAHIAWGLTNVMADDADFYIERIDSTLPRNYIYDGQSLPIRVREEEIRVKGVDTVEYVRIRSTHHGPIVTDISTSLKHAQFPFVAAMRWTGFEINDQIEAFNKVNKAKNWSEFTEGVRGFSGPGQNFVYADIRGNIGYQCGVLLPRRNSLTNPTLPVPGWTRETEWQGFVPFEQLPHLFNPPEGYIATANNKIVDDSYPYHISHLWEPPSRVQRLRELLGREGKFDHRDFELFQNDQFSQYAKELTPYIIQACEGQLEAPYGELVIDYFRNWNFTFTQTDVATGIYQQFLTLLMKNIYEDEMGGDLFHDYLILVNVPLRVTQRLLQQGTSSWFDNIRTPATEGRDDVIRESMREAIATLRSKFGDQTRNWQWGNLHKLILQHPFGLQKPLDRLFNLGPFPYGGGSTSLSSGEYSLTGALRPGEFEQPFAVTVGASFRHVVDLSKPGESYTVLPTGQSGQVLNTHYDDQTPLYLNGLYKVTRADENRLTVDHLTLKPAR